MGVYPVGSHLIDFAMAAEVIFLAIEEMAFDSALGLSLQQRRRQRISEQMVIDGAGLTFWGKGKGE